MKTRAIALATSGLAAVLVLAGCAAAPTGAPSEMPGMNPGSPSTGSPFNDADATFAMNMIAHHQQAIQMADLILDKEGVDERVARLARDIQAAQGPEIDAMTTWLADWGQPIDSGMDHGGMMSDADMTALASASGPEAGPLFLEQMIEHHQGAIDMADLQLVTGRNAEALALAQTIIDAQTAEIATMQEIRRTL